MALPALAGVGTVLKGVGGAVLGKELISGLMEFEAVRGWVTSLVELVVPGAQAKFLTFQLKSRADYITKLVQALMQAEDAVAPQMMQLAALGLEDFFGVSIPPGSIGKRGGTPGRDIVETTLANAMIEALFGSLPHTTSITPEKGWANMKRIAEKSIGLAVEGWLEKNLGLGPLTKDLPNFGDLDDIVFRGMGLGRVTSRGLRPLVDALISTPATRYVNKTYTPMLPSTYDLARMFYREQIEMEQYLDLMAQLGWPRDLATDRLYSAGVKLSKSDLRGAMELDLLSADAVRDRLLTEGLSGPDAVIAMEVLQQDRIRTLRNQVVSVARDQYRDRAIEESEFRAVVGEVGYTPEEYETLLALAELEHSRPKDLTLSQVENGYIIGAVGFEEFQVWLDLHGYSPRSVEILSELAAKRKLDYERREERRREPVDPASRAAVPQSVAIEAYRRNLMTRSELVLILQARGLQGPTLEHTLQVADARRKDYQEAVAKKEAPKQALTASSGSVEDAYVRGLVGDTELQSFYGELGFEGERLRILLLLRAMERQEYQQRKAAAAERAAAGEQSTITG